MELKQYLCHFTSNGRQLLTVSKHTTHLIKDKLTLDIELNLMYEHVKLRDLSSWDSV